MSKYKLSIIVTTSVFCNIDRFKLTLYGLVDQHCKFDTKERDEQHSDETLRREACDIFNNLINNKINWLEPRTSTQESFEIIVVIDNSEQNNYVYSYRDNHQLPQIIELCETFKKDLQKHNLSNIGFQYHINDTNRRVSYSRNFGIDVAQGEYITTCDDDDIKINGYTLIDAINDVNTTGEIHEVIFCQHFDIKNKRLLDGTLTTLPKDFNDVIDNYITRLQIGIHQSLIIHRSIYDNNKIVSRFIVGIFNEDIIWFNILMEYLTSSMKINFAYSPEIIYIYVSPTRSMNNISLIDIYKPGSDILAEEFKTDIRLNLEQQQVVLQKLFETNNYNLTPSFVKASYVVSRASRQQLLKFIGNNINKFDTTVKSLYQLNRKIHERYIKENKNINWLSKLKEIISYNELLIIAHNLLNNYDEAVVRSAIQHVDKYIGTFIISPPHQAEMLTELLTVSNNCNNENNDSNDCINELVNEYFYRCYLYFKKDSDMVKIHEIANSKHNMFEIAWYCHTKNHHHRVNQTDFHEKFIEMLNYSKLHNKNTFSHDELSQLAKYECVNDYIRETQYDSILQYRPGASVHMQNPSVISVLFMLNA